MTAPDPVPRPAVAAGRVEPTARRLRALLGDDVLLDTGRALYRWEWPWYPRHHVHPDELAADVVDAGGPRPGPVTGDVVVDVGLRTPSADVADAGWRVVAVGEGSDQAAVGTVRLHQDVPDAWFEEDERIVLHPRSPYVRVDALRSSRVIEVSLDGVRLARSTSPVLLFETALPPRAYLDPADVDLDRLRPSSTATVCPYKGTTGRWWSVLTASGEHADLAWSYDEPVAGLEAIRGRIAFYDERVDVRIDGRDRPRPVTHLAGP